MSTADWPARPLPIPAEPDHHGAGTTRELRLRPWRVPDAEALAAAWRDPELRRWLDPPETGVGAAREWIEGEATRRQAGLALDLVVDLDGAVIGEVGLWRFDTRRRACMVGYWVMAPHRGHGHATQALVAATAFFRDALDGAAMIAECHRHNLASCRTAEAAGFEPLAIRDDISVYGWRADR
mgnify:CR=1 FL=1